MKADGKPALPEVNLIDYTQQNCKVFNTDRFRGKERCMLSNVQEKSIDQSNLSACKCLQMYHTNIETLSTKEMPKIEELTFFDGQLVSLNLTGAANLKTLKIQACQIQELNLDCCKLIEHLDVSQTKLARLDTRSLQKVKELNFAGTEIKYLDFRCLPELKKTTLSGSIDHIDLRCCLELQEITLGGGRLCYLRFRHRVQLKKVDKHSWLRSKDFRQFEVAKAGQNRIASAAAGQQFFLEGQLKEDAEMNQIDNYRRSYVVIDDDDDANSEQVAQFDKECWSALE